MPVDERTNHYGEPIAGTKWKAVSTDALWGRGAAPQLIQERFVQELSASGLFARVTTGPAQPGDIVLKTDIHAFCSQIIGFIYMRAAGISAVEVTLQKGDKTLNDQKFQSVVTDADDEYIGSNVGTVEQSMRAVMADSLRVLMRNMIKQLESDSANWPKDSATAQTP